MKKRAKSKSNRREDVLYLTLVDFFLQMLFLTMIALLFYIVYYWGCVKVVGTTEEITENMVLIDRQLKEQGEDALAFIAENGGKDEIEAAIKKMRKGLGLPPCAGLGADGQAKSSATLIATDSTITLRDWQPEFAELYRRLGKGELKANMQWSLKGFVWAWNGAVQLEPKCRYTITLIERTGQVRPRDHVQSVFYAKIRRG